jgi:hypothetical protein
MAAAYPGDKKERITIHEKQPAIMGFILGLYKAEMINHAIKKAASSNKNENN